MILSKKVAINAFHELNPRKGTETPQYADSSIGGLVTFHELNPRKGTETIIRS